MTNKIRDVCYKKNISRKLLIILPLLLLCTVLSAQQYQIVSLKYEIDGRTREDVIAPIVAINTAHIFGSLQELEQYFVGRQGIVEQLRTLESILIIPTYGSPNEQNIIPVDVIVNVKDSLNLILFPYPKYDSNTGTEFKLKIIDYNFLGFMRTLDSEIFYIHDTDIDSATGKDKDDYKLGGAVTFGIPFKLGPFYSTWNNSLNLSYTLNNNTPDASLTTGLGFHYPLNNFFGLNLALNLTVSQGITYNPDYKQWGDALYFSQFAWFNISIFLAWNEFLGGIYWTPNIHVAYYWDEDGINPLNLDLIDTDIIFGHSLSSWNIKWVGNFRDGLHISISQSLHRETHRNQFYISASITALYFKSFEDMQIATRLWILENNGNRWDIGHMIRGMRTQGVHTDSAVVVNFDLPIKIWQTDWVGYGFWNWTEWFDFELQISPFIDVIIGKNHVGGKNYDLKDGWYAAGLEVLVYPNKARSLQGRISLGVDLVKFAEKVGNNIGFVAPIVDKLFGDTAWRYANNESWYELFIGIGVHY